MKQILVEEKLAQRNRELSALNRIAQLMARSINLKDLMQHALDGVLEVMDSTLGAIWLVDESADTMSLAVHKGLNEELIKLIQGRSQILPSLSYTRRVLETDSVLVTYNLSEEVLPVYRPFFKRYKFNSAAGIPLRSKGETLGVMVITSHTQRTFSAEEIRLLDTIGNQIGVAIKHVQLFEKVQAQQADLESYITQITKAQEEERRRIARDLHDEMAQSLAVLSIRIQGIVRNSKALPVKTVEHLNQLQNEINIILDSVRNFIHELRPEVLDQLGLIPAIEFLSEELNNKENIDARIEIIGDQQRLSSEIEVTLFRIAQEAIRNIKKHSEATEVNIRIEFNPKTVVLCIMDNGKGFEPPKTLSRFADSGKLGLIGMMERARLLNGSFLVKTGEGKGTAITVEINK